MKKIMAILMSCALFASVALVGCTKPEEEMAPEGTTTDTTTSAPAAAPADSGAETE
jgi:hypothetical protein